MAAVIIAFGWTMVESFLYYLGSKRRLRLGLVEAPVCNRFLLWALAKAAFFSMGSLAAIMLVLGLNPLSYGVFTLLVGVTGLLNSVCMILCFMPPESYLDWLRRRAAAMQRA
jgi:hypothetical protein